MPADAFRLNRKLELQHLFSFCVTCEGTETVQVTPFRRTQCLLPNPNALVAFIALTLLVGPHEGHLACKN